jgi:hypothetical protein
MSNRSQPPAAQLRAPDLSSPAAPAQELRPHTPGALRPQRRAGKAKPNYCTITSQGSGVCLVFHRDWLGVAGANCLESAVGGSVRPPLGSPPPKPWTWRCIPLAAAARNPTSQKPPEQLPKQGQPPFVVRRAHVGTAALGCPGEPSSPKLHTLPPVILSEGERPSRKTPTGWEAPTCIREFLEEIPGTNVWSANKREVLRLRRMIRQRITRLRSG